MDIVDRFPLYPLFYSFVVFPAVAWALLKFIKGSARMPLFASFSAISLAVMCWLSGAKAVRLAFFVPYTKATLFFFFLYMTFILVYYVLLWYSQKNTAAWTFSFLVPVFFLVCVKYLIGPFNPFAFILAPAGLLHFEAFFIGLSYLSFRLVLLAQELRNEYTTMPTIWEYFAYATYTPTLSIGPINPYGKFIASIKNPDRQATPVGRSLLRIVVGFTKYIFLSSIAAQFTYAGLLWDGHPHTRGDALIAVLVFPLYLYCNFSGFCDVVIGVSGLLGIQVPENFDQPFLARNYQEFWNHWHITLSTWIRDIVFTPLAKSLVRRFGPRSANHCVAAAILVAFVIVGVWHGKGLNFLAFGVLQGVGLVTVHYYTAWLKQKLGRGRFAQYRQNQTIRYVTTVMTYGYFAFTLIFFANTLDQLRGLLHILL
jgi:D-alanyl-lipoteichoic acid acyltransferase DltB (MBOAT superfamily)